MLAGNMAQTWATLNRYFGGTADLYTNQVAGKRSLIALRFLLQPEVISDAAAY
jgi:hypothetical protein